MAFDFSSLFSGLMGAQGAQGTQGMMGMGSDAASLQAAQAGQQAPGFWQKLLDDPNTLQALATAGAGIGQGKGVGASLGGAANQLVTNRAYQKAAGTQREANRMSLQELIKALQGDTELITDKTEQNGANSMKITPDKISLLYPNKINLGGTNGVI